jgi:predicted dehydrogenase
MVKLRCGVVGLGRGKLFIKVLSSIKDCRVVAACDQNPAVFEGLSGIETFTDYDKFLDQKLDVVAVISPAPYHYEQSVKALERGAHVLCETPCVYTVDEARKVVSLVQKSGLKYMLAEQCIWMGFALTLRRMAEEGKFGEITYAEGDYTHDCRGLMLEVNGKWIPYAERDKHPEARKTWRATNLPPITYCSHTLGPILKITGARAVSALGLAVKGKTAPELCPTDLESGLFETDRGGVIRLTNGFCVAHPYGLFYKFVGTRGSAVMMRLGGDVARWYSELDGGPENWKTMTPDMLERPDRRSPEEAMVEEFIESIRKDSKPPLDVHESLDMVLPGVLAHQSAQKGGAKLPVPDTRKAF